MPGTRVGESQVWNLLFVLDEMEGGFIVGSHGPAGSPCRGSGVAPEKVIPFETYLLDPESGPESKIRNGIGVGFTSLPFEIDLASLPFDLPRKEPPKRPITFLKESFSMGRQCECGETMFVDASGRCTRCRQRAARPRFITIGVADGDGGHSQVAICFPEEGTPDEDYLLSEESVLSEGQFDLNFDDPDCPFVRGAVYREV